jgi:Spy/CpxP family protein refolding chaperone
MKSNHGQLAAVLAMGAALLAGASSSAPAQAADDASGAVAPPAGPSGGPHGWGHGWGDPGHGGPLHLYSKLELSAEQQASMQAIMTAAKPQMQSLHQQMRANQLKEIETKPDDPNYATVVAEVAQTNASLAAQRTTLSSGLRTQMYAVLTPAQRTQLATLEAQWAAKPHGAHFGPRGPAGTPPATPEG